MAEPQRLQSSSSMQSNTDLQRMYAYRAKIHEISALLIDEDWRKLTSNTIDVLTSDLREIIKGFEEIRTRPISNDYNIDGILDDLNNALGRLYEFSDLREKPDLGSKSSYYTKIRECRESLNLAIGLMPIKGQEDLDESVSSYRLAELPINNKQAVSEGEQRATKQPSPRSTSKRTRNRPTSEKQSVEPQHSSITAETELPEEEEKNDTPQINPSPSIAFQETPESTKVPTSSVQDIPNQTESEDKSSTRTDEAGLLSTSEASNLSSVVVQDTVKGDVPYERIEIAIRALSDTPSDIDLLKFSDYADALVDFIMSKKTQKPLTIAIDAMWGMGKTTLMRMIKHRLEGQTDKEMPISTPTRIDLNKKEQNTPVKSSFPIVWFNAWQYDQEDLLWAALALEILDQVGKQSTLIKKVGFRWKLTQKRLGKRNLIFKVAFRLLPFFIGLVVLIAILFSVGWLWQGNSLFVTLKSIFLPIAGILGGVTLIYASAKDVYTRFIKPLDQKIAQYIRDPNYKDRIGFLGEFKDDFLSIVDVATSEGKWPLIIFIDDLDRCSPPKPVEIIEAINLLLDAQNCVFVMGMDMRTVAGSIEAKYKDMLTYLGTTDSPGELTLGQRFLEKIIQITFHLPRADTNVVQSFIDTILISTKENIGSSSSSAKVQEVAQLIVAEQRGGIKPLDAAAERVMQTRSDISEVTLVKAKEEIRAKSFDDSQVVQDVIREVAPF